MLYHYPLEVIYLRLLILISICLLLSLQQF